MKRKSIPRSVIKFCAAVVDFAETEPYLSAIARAEKTVGSCYSKSATQERAALAKAIRLNLINQKEWPYTRLVFLYDLPIHENTFSREKIRFCKTLAKELGFWAEEDETPFETERGKDEPLIS